MSYKINAGIYKITNITNNKIYIGSTKFLNRRKSSHFRDLISNKHASIHLQRSFNKHGLENFKWEIIELCNYNRELLLKREQYYLDNLLFAQEFIKNENNKFIQLGYNINPIAGSPSNRKVSKETKLKMSNSHIGLKHTTVSKLKMSLIRLDTKISDETRKNMSKPKTEEHKKHMREGSKNKTLPKDFGEKSLNGRKLNIIIDGIEYLNSVDASNFLNISRATICRRVKSDKYSQYYKKYVKKL